MVGTLLIGLSIAMLLFLLAAGLTLIFGLLGVLNFSHGALYMLGAFVAYQISVYTGSLLLAVVVSVVAVALLGALFELTLLRPLYAREHVDQLLMTFGMILVIGEVVRMIWGLGYRNMPPSIWFQQPVQILGESVPTYRLLVIGVGISVALGLYLLIEKTRLGMVLRASMTHPTMVRSLGIPVRTVRTMVFALGAGLAALAGAIAAPLVPIQVGMDTKILIDCFVVVILGGLGSIRGPVLAALLVGGIQAFGQKFFASWAEIVIFGLLVIVLLVRPTGLFASRGRAA